MGPRLQPGPRSLTYASLVLVELGGGVGDTGVPNSEHPRTTLPHSPRARIRLTRIRLSVRRIILNRLSDGNQS